MISPIELPLFFAWETSINFITKLYCGNKLNYCICCTFTYKGKGCIDLMNNFFVGIGLGEKERNTTHMALDGEIREGSIHRKNPRRYFVRYVGLASPSLYMGIVSNWASLVILNCLLLLDLGDHPQKIREIVPCG